MRRVCSIAPAFVYRMATFPGAARKSAGARENSWASTFSVVAAASPAAVAGAEVAAAGAEVAAESAVVPAARMGHGAVVEEAEPDPLASLGGVGRRGRKPFAVDGEATEPVVEDEELVAVRRWFAVPVPGLHEQCAGQSLRDLLNRAPVDPSSAAAFRLFGNRDVIHGTPP